MSDTTTVDWRDYLIEAGYFQAEIPALYADLATTADDATITVEAAADDQDDVGITVGFWLPDILADARFEVDGAHPQQVHTAREYAAAIAAAAAATEPTSVQLHAWSTEAMPNLEPVPVTIAAGADPSGLVYLDITGQQPAAVLLSRPDAAHLAQLIHAAIDYLAATGYRCVVCDAATTATAQASHGGRTGPICPHCQHWCDGNTTT